MWGTIAHNYSYTSFSMFRNVAFIIVVNLFWRVASLSPTFILLVWLINRCMLVVTTINMLFTSVMILLIVILLCSLFPMMISQCSWGLLLTHSISIVLSTLVPLHLCLSWGSRIRHRDVIRSGSCVPNRWVFRGWVLRASVSIRRTACSKSWCLTWYIVVPPVSIGIELLLSRLCHNSGLIISQCISHSLF